MCAIACIISALPAATVIMIDQSAWPLGAALSAVLGAALAAVVVRWHRSESRLRRLEYMSDRISALVASLPRQSDLETLAVLHEIRNCYVEARELAVEFGDKGRRLAEAMRKGLESIDKVYGMQTGSLRRTDANAADFARMMREMGRDVDGSLRP